MASLTQFYKEVMLGPFQPPTGRVPPESADFAPYAAVFVRLYFVCRFCTLGTIGCYHFSCWFVFILGHADALYLPSRSSMSARLPPAVSVVTQAPPASVQLSQSRGHTWERGGGQEAFLTTGRISSSCHLGHLQQHIPWPSQTLDWDYIS